MNQGKITVKTFLKKKKNGEKIKMITTYDYTFARIVDSTDIDGILVGDSLGMVIQGHENTLSVTVDDIIYHTRSVKRGISRVHLVSDMPFMSYQVSLEQGIRNAGRLVKEGGAHAVKIEGGRRVCDLVYRLTEMGIPVMGHIGLTPQSINQFGGYKIQGKGIKEGLNLIEDAKALVDAGVYAIVLEGIPAPLSKKITEEISVPTIGIGAGKYTDGQILVIYDLLGLDPDFNPKFLKKYSDLYTVIKNSLNQYCDEVEKGKFPTDEQSFYSKNWSKE